MPAPGVGGVNPDKPYLIPDEPISGNRMTSESV